MKNSENGVPYFFGDNMYLPFSNILEKPTPQKERLVRQKIVYMFARTSRMFKYAGLPDTIPEQLHERILQTNGAMIAAEHEGKLYTFFGSFGGDRTPYYFPKNFIVSNPYLKLYKTYTIGEDCVLLRSDSMLYGLLPIFRYYCTMLSENDITMNIRSVMSRSVALITGKTDSDKASGDEYIRKIIDGDMSAVAQEEFIGGISTQPYSASGSSDGIIPFIEYQQYIKAQMYNEIGLSANYNMKRESIGGDEAGLNTDSILPLADDMLKCRQEDWQKVNEMFGTSVSVDFDSAWDNRQEIVKAEVEQVENEAEPESEPEEPPKEGENDENENS